MKKKTISIIRTFSVFNPTCPQHILEFSNGEFWSMAQIGMSCSSWVGMSCEMDKNDKIIKHNTWESIDENCGGSFSLDELTDTIWKRVNKLEEVA